MHFWDLLVLQELSYAQLQAVAGSVRDPTRFPQVSVFQIMVCSNFSLQSSLIPIVCICSVGSSGCSGVDVEE
jgi:hypothetical protein